MKARYSPGCSDVGSAIEKSRICSSWIWASRSGTAAGFFSPVQPFGASFRGVEVDDEAAGGVGGQGGGVRVGDLVGDDLLDGGRPHLHHVAVRLAGPLRGAGDGPDAGAVVAPHRDVLPVEFQGDGLRGGSPDGEGGTAVAEDRAERRGARALPVQVVEHTCALYAGGGEQSAVGGALGGDQLAAQRLADPVPVTRVDGERRVVLEVRVLRLLGVGQRGRGEPQPPALVGERPVDDGDPAVLRVDELLAGGVGGLHLPHDGVGVDPLCLGLGEVGGGHTAGLRQQIAGLSGDHPHLVVVRGDVERLVAGEVLLVALVKDVAERGGAVGERHLEGDAVGVLLHRLERLGPVRGFLGAGPGVQSPAVVVAVGPVVVQDGLRPVLRRVGALGGLVGLAVLALLDPDLPGPREVDGALRPVGCAVLLDGVRDGGHALVELDPGERTVGVASGELGGPVARLDAASRRSRRPRACSGRRRSRARRRRASRPPGPVPRSSRRGRSRCARCGRRQRPCSAAVFPPPPCCPGAG